MWRIFIAAFFQIGAGTMLLHVAAAQAQPAPGDAVERHAFKNWTKVTDPASGIAGANLFPPDRTDRMPLNNPDWRGSAQADHMEPDDEVVGLSLHGKSWALPLWLLRCPHLANLTLDGEPVLVSFCVRCRSAMARHPVVKGQRLTFHVHGVYNGSILLADDQTKTYWTPFTGEALEGALKGANLRQVPMIQCRWDQWLEMHPETLVAYGPKKMRRGYEQAQRLGSFRLAQGFTHLLVQPLDRRLPFDDFVLGVAVGDEMRAYPLAVLDEPDIDKKNIALNDTVGDKPIVILHERDSSLTTVFSRRLRGETLEFATDKDERFVDSTYHSHWNYHGEAVDGPVAGQKLSYIPSQLEDWYIWAAYHPTTTLYSSSNVAGAGGN